MILWSLAEKAYRLSVIIVCRFLLGIRQQNSHPNGTSQTHQASPMNSFHAVAQHVGNSVAEEFGDSFFNESLAMSQSHGESMELQDITPQTQFEDGRVSLTEFPWATGDIGALEQGRVAESGANICLNLLIIWLISLFGNCRRLKLGVDIEGANPKSDEGQVI